MCAPLSAGTENPVTLNSEPQPQLQEDVCAPTSTPTPSVCLIYGEELQAIDGELTEVEVCLSPKH